MSSVKILANKLFSCLGFMAWRHMAAVEVKLQAVFTLQQDGHLHTPNALIQVRQLLVPTDEKDKCVPQMVCTGKQRESLCPFHESNLGHPDCNLTLPLTTNLISLTKERNNRTKDEVLKPTGHVLHHQFNIQQLYALPTLYLCVLYLSENKQWLVPLTA